MLYNQVKNGTRLLTGYAKDLDYWFLDQIFSEGIDTNYEDSVSEFRKMFKSDVKDLTNEALKNLKKITDVGYRENWIKNHFNWQINDDQRLVEIVLDTILKVTKDTKISELKSDLKDLEDQLIEIAFEYYESDSTKFFLKTKDYTVEFSNYDNSYTVLKSKLTGRFNIASPCFPNGCYSDPNKQGFKAFRLPLDCYSDEYKEQHKEQINWKK
jgi:hypothetical protein